MTDPWEGFLVGPENALAHAGVVALARGDEAAVAPLVLHGPSGAGKTRLLTGMIGECLARRPGAVVALLTAEAFAAACAEAAETPGGWAELRGRFRGLDLLALDDLHALERAPLARAELAHTLDALADAGGSAAVTARVGPGQWSGWPPRLVNRLVGGLAVRVDPPGLETRRRYLWERARSRRLSAEAVDALAAAAAGYRDLDGWLARLALVHHGPIGREQVEALWRDDLVPSPPAIEQVARAVAARFGVAIRDLRAASRRRALVEPRHLAMYLARRAAGLSFAAIGVYFGGRDPATVRHACRTAARRLDADPALAAAVAALGRSWRQDTAED